MAITSITVLTLTICTASHVYPYASSCYVQHAPETSAAACEASAARYDEPDYPTKQFDDEDLKVGDMFLASRPFCSQLNVPAGAFAPKGALPVKGLVPKLTLPRPKLI